MALSYENVPIFYNTLGGGASAQHPQVARLRSSYESLRLRTVPLLQQIPRDLPALTIHDLTHLDALWSSANLILGDGYPLNPLEGYVLGGAILLHDAGMVIAAYEGGIDEIRSLAFWRDAKASFEKSFSRSNESWEEIQKRSECAATAETLRSLHADKAREIATREWSNKDSSSYLIDDPELREFLGETIGVVAKSHNEDHSYLRENLSRTVGAPPGFPVEWTIDPLKVACILRVADAAHISAERAPRFSRLVFQPAGVSDDHWNFQSRFYQPYCEPSSSLVFTSRAFGISDVQAWWLARDVLRMVDRELRLTNELLAETDTPQKPRPCFKVQRVSGVERADLLEELLPAEGWQPVDTTFEISDPVEMVENFGGSRLYGNTPSVILRELLQNASDAIRARRAIDPDYHRLDEVIQVELSESGGGWILSISDNGIGMSERTLSKKLVKFGGSGWCSSDAKLEFPGLLSSDFMPIGKFGIGFFSVFMMSNRVSVISKRFDQEKRCCLEFYNGVKVPGTLVRLTGTSSSAFSTKISIHLSKNQLLSILECGFVDYNGEAHAIDPNQKLIQPEIATGGLLSKLCRQIVNLFPGNSIRLVIKNGAEQVCLPQNYFENLPDWVLRNVSSERLNDIWPTIESIVTSKIDYSSQQEEVIDSRYSCLFSDYNGNEIEGRASLFVSEGESGFILVRGVRTNSSVGYAGFLPGDTNLMSRERASIHLSEIQKTQLRENQVKKALEKNSPLNGIGILSSLVKKEDEIRNLPLFVRDGVVCGIEQFVEDIKNFGIINILKISRDVNKRKNEKLYSKSVRLFDSKIPLYFSLPILEELFRFALRDDNKFIEIENYPEIPTDELLQNGMITSEINLIIEHIKNSMFPQLSSVNIDFNYDLKINRTHLKKVNFDFKKVDLLRTGTILSYLIKKISLTKPDMRYVLKQSYTPKFKFDDHIDKIIIDLAIEDVAPNDEISRIIFSRMSRGYPKIDKELLLHHIFEDKHYLNLLFDDRLAEEQKRQFMDYIAFKRQFQNAYFDVFSIA